MPEPLPLLFACSGCSNAGQLADQLARELDRRGIAEMSCLAGVSAGKSLFLKKLVDREAWVVDGCPIACSLGVFAQLGEQIDVHIRLHDLGVRKNAPLPAGSEFEGLVAAALRQVAEQKRQRTQAISNDDDATNQTASRMSVKNT
jgi:uncharacterized metal-binding protein